MGLSVDVVIVTKDRPEKLFRVVLSLLANSTLPTAIVVIDSSTLFLSAFYIPYIKKLCRTVGVRLVYKSRVKTGISFARNTGIACCISDIVAFIDDDEIASINWIKTIKDVFSRNHQCVVITGPRVPYCKSNFWNTLWGTILRYEQGYKGYRDFIFGDNACYRLSFIKKHMLRFDPRMKISSEDLSITYQILQSGERVFFCPELQIYHDFRTRFIDFMRQWFWYGFGTYEFHYYYRINSTLGLGSVNVLRSALSRSMRWSPSFIPIAPLQFIGLACRDLVFLSGYLYSIIVMIASGD